MNTNKTQQAINRIIDLLERECDPKKMSKEEYLETLEGVADRVESFIDCVKYELENER